MKYSPKPYLDAFRDKIKSRGARGIIGLQRVFKVINLFTNWGFNKSIQYRYSMMTTLKV